MLRKLYVFCFFMLPFQIYIATPLGPLGIFLTPLLVVSVFIILKLLLTKRIRIPYEILGLFAIMLLSTLFSEIPLTSARKSFTLIISLVVFIAHMHFYTEEQEKLAFNRYLLISSGIVGLIGASMGILFVLWSEFKFVWFAFVKIYGGSLFGPTFLENVEADDINLTYFGRGYEGWFPEGLIRNSGIFQVHFEMGYYSVFFLIVALITYFHNKKKLYLFIALLHLIGVVTTYSRSTYIVLFIALITFYYFRKSFGFTFSLRKVGLSLFLILIISFFIPGTPVNAFYVGLSKMVTEKQDETDLEFRKETATISVSAIIESPLWGSGRGVFEEKYNELPHYGPIKFLTDFGLFGLYFLAVFYFRSIKASFNNQLFRLSAINSIMVIMGPALVVGYFFAEYLSASKVLPIFMVYFAMVRKTGES